MTKTLQKTLHTLPELNAAGLISDNETSALREVAARYAVAVTQPMAALIDSGDPADPMARQFIPSLAELDRRPGERDDPIGDYDKSPVRGIVHRYTDRVLLKAVGVCPVYCRFCFRREMVGPQHDANLSDSELDNALGYIAAHPEIWEVIITGGDPLILSPRRIRDLTARLSQIDHVKVVRWHTRVPVVSPQLVTDDLAACLASSRQTAFLALHSNHPKELTPEARVACRRLAKAGLSLVSQSVLLRGVNDDADTLESLMRGFVEIGVKPYYLHHPDLAPGTGHFRVALETGQQIMRELRRRLSGLAMPTYVLDIPGAHGKIPAGPQYLHRDNNDATTYSITDRAGEGHAYRDSC
ncbi:MAG: lysine 2,3-aminomutase [Alphaproteobacteria bacterium BRH_c36]|nr:MAG: lysine 2,3-aminomutase [Alphaproteobacteria bacterium BRH_c36]KUO69605.1 MAG: lysine 2,3-aminomutase [Alphaproteobacteria bacterium BRH_c36]